jgi:hypothetical protein
MKELLMELKAEASFYQINDDSIIGQKKKIQKAKAVAQKKLYC